MFRAKMYRQNRSKKKNLKERIGFTLAEVLLVIAVIGIIASYTIPELIQNVQEQQYKIAYKKAFGDLSNVLNSCLSEDSLFSREGGNNDNVNNGINFNVLKSKFSVIKECNNNDNYQCWDAIGEKYNEVLPNTAALAFIDKSGRAWSMLESRYSEIIVDTNGFKNPNIYGKDRFPFWVTTINGDNHDFPGVPVKITPYIDYVGAYIVRCPSGNCYYKSWLTNSK